jgi:hypothetical protein
MGQFIDRLHHNAASLDTPLIEHAPIFSRYLAQGETYQKH